MSARRRTVGFTLMEVMIVVAILAALMLVALPAYQDQLLKGRRADGMGALLDVASRQEKYFLDRSTYTDDLEDLNLDDPWYSDENYYEIEISTPTDPNCPLASCFELTATPNGAPQNADKKCTKLILNSRGTQSAEGSDADNCW